MPSRSVDRNGELSVSLNAAVAVGGFRNGRAYSDGGFGLALQFRPVEALGIEAGFTQFGGAQDEGFLRSQSVFHSSAKLYATPWSTVSPFIAAGVTANYLDFEGQIDGTTGAIQVDAQGLKVGPHIGTGIQISLGQSFSIDLEGRYTSLISSHSSDTILPGTFQLGAASVLHF